MPSLNCRLRNSQVREQLVCDAFLIMSNRNACTVSVMDTRLMWHRLVIVSIKNNG